MSSAEMAIGRESSPPSALRPIHSHNAPQRIRLVIADDHALFRDALRMVLVADGGFAVVAEAANGRDALAAITRTSPDIALVDLALPLMNGLELAAQLRRSGAATRVVILASRDQESLLLRVLDSGVAGYLSKGADFQELTIALRKVHSGYCYLTPSQGEHWGDRKIRRLRTLESGGSIDLLTSRERELLRLVAEGRTNREIASLLCVSVKTVEAHKANICGKLNIRGNAGLMRHAIHAQIMGLPG